MRWSREQEFAVENLAIEPHTLPELVNWSHAEKHLFL